MIICKLILFGLGVMVHAAPLMVNVASKTRIVSLDPYQLAGLEAYEISGLALEPLARIAIGTRRLTPCLARRWKINPARKSLVVELRPHVRFHDGTEMTADDVQFSFDSFFDPRYHGEIWRGRFVSVESARKLNRYAVEFKFKDLNYTAVENLLTGLRVMPRAFYQIGRDFRRELMGTGPFRLTRFGETLEFAPFPHWWGPNPPRFSLRLKYVADPELAAQMVSKGELDFYAATGELPPSPTRHLLEVGAGEGIWIDLNLKREVFRDTRVREALLKLWNRPALAQKLFTVATVALDAFSPRMPKYPAGKPLSFDPARARALLAESGYGLRKQLEFSILSPNLGADRWLTRLQADAASVGVKIEILHSVDSAEHWARPRDGKFDAVVGEGGLSDSVSESTWSSTGVYNLSGFSDVKVDADLLALNHEFNLNRRQTMVAEIVKKIRSAVLQLPGVYMLKQSFLFSKRLTVDVLHPTEPWRWTLEGS